MKKRKTLFLLVTIILTVTISVSTAYAATIIFASNEVSYSNTTSGMSSTNVQSAIDELYTEANKYKGLDDRLDVLETRKSNIYYNSSELYSGPSAVSVPTATNTNTTALITLQPGVYVLFAAAVFNANATGYRDAFIAKTTDTTYDCSNAQGVISHGNTTAISSSDRVVLNFQGVANPTETTKYYVCAYQNSGSALNVTGRIQAFRFK